MPYTLEDYKREVRERRLKELKHPTPEEKEAVLSALSPEERLEGLSKEEIEAFLKTLDSVSEVQD
jgi:hypothetical protein